MPDQASTPPHHPAYNVRLSPERINHIISTLYPDHTVSVTEGPRGASYNNRIYFLDIAPRPLSAATTNPTKPLQAVLKVAGHFFDHRKIQNEIASLLLFARYCPSVPVPLAIAWSEDGTTISTSDRTVPDPSHIPSQPSHGWILMTRLPGRTLTSSDLDGPSGPSLLHQIALLNASWRTSIPSVPLFGNIRHLQPTDDQSSALSLDTKDPPPPPHPPPATTTPPPSSSNQSYTIGGFLLCYRYDPHPIRSALEYYTYMLKDQIHRVMTSKAYDDVRCDLVPLIAEFVERDLHHLLCVRESNTEGRTGVLNGVFSHMDHAPRNILVSEENAEGGGGLLKVTGLVDFEFAAFLPEMDEFVNCTVRQEGDWEERHWKILMQEMAKMGCKVPPPLVGEEVMMAMMVMTPTSSSNTNTATATTEEGTVDDDKDKDKEKGEQRYGEIEWREVCLLWKLIDNIAPWYIMEGKMTPGELNKELDKAGRVVRDCIARIQALKPVMGDSTGGGGEVRNGAGKNDEEMEVEVVDVMVVDG